MDSTDTLINALYCSATEGDWQSFRGRALGLLCERFGASAAAWWSRGSRDQDGALTQHPQPFLTSAALTRLVLPQGQEAAVLEISASAQAFVYRAPATELLHTVVLNYPARAQHAVAGDLERVGGHLCGAGALSMVQFVRRDDWLHAMGRANRGSAALVDAAGTVYAVSARFRGLLEETGQAGDTARLPFVLPESVLGEEGGEVMEGGLHLRVARCGSLYLLHARKPLPLDALSPREQEIARALSNGKTLKSIARQYGIAVSTVANHTTRIYRKLAIYRREDLIELLHMKPSTVR
ncbi:MAG: helix-turn-helix transcriptional regulator [Nevskia sp.]|nr:helix-turn-helix transcriptional regulator [Nevskia sp.]